MGIAIISIMLFHQEFSSIPPLNIFHNYGHWGVEIFLFLSGMGMVKSLRTHQKIEFYKRRFIRLFPSCLLFGTNKLLFYCAVDPSLSVLKEGLHIGWWSCLSLDLWFVNVIAVYYAICPLLFFLIKRLPIVTLFTIFLSCIISHLYICTYTGSDWASPFGLVNWALGRLPVFSLGMYFSLHPKMLTKGFLMVSCLTFVSALLLVVTRKHICILPLWALIQDICIAIGTVFMVFICVRFLQTVKNGIVRFLSCMGNASLELYLVHEFIIWAIYVKFHGISNDLLLLLIALVISYIIAVVGKQMLVMINNKLFNR